MYSFTGTWLPNKTTYKVNLWFEKIEVDGYELFTSDEYQSSTGPKVGVRADFYDCMIFEESKSVSEAVVKADGSTSLDLYYRRTRYSITFDGDGGELKSGVVFQVLKFQQQPEVPVFTKVGFDFVGWNKEISEATEDVVYKAIWKEQKIEKVAITNTLLLQDLPISNVELTCSVTTSKPNYMTFTFEIVSMVPSDMGATISNNLLNVNFAGKVGIKAICEGVESEIVYFEFSKKLSGINLDSTNNIDLEYYQYQSIDYGCAKLLLTYSDTSTELVELLPSYFSDFDTLTTGDKTFTIEYLNLKHTYEYKVIPVSVGLNFVDHSTYYSLNGIGDCKDTFIIVPFIYNQKPVKEVAGNAFFENASITSIIFTGGVETIGDYAFSKCSNLSSVILSDSVISIATNGFSNCINLKVFECGNALVSIGQFGFYNCSKLAKIVLPNTLNKLFAGAFEDCSELREVTLSNSLDIINLQVFSNCVSLTSIAIPDSVLSIEQNAFENCKMLARVTFGNQLKTIGVWAFRSCESLTEAIFPDSLESIQKEAFHSCSKLSIVHFGKNFYSFGSSIFNNCGNIKTCTIDKENTRFSTTGNCIIHIESKTLVLGFASTVIPTDGSVEIIGESSFSGIEALSSIVIPEGIKEIRTSAFEGCTNLAGTITIPNSVVKIGSDVFINCSSLEGIVLPDSITEIPNNFCYGCLNLKTITMSDEVTSIKAYAFYDCSNLELTYLPEKLLELGIKSLYVSNLSTIAVNNV